MACAVRVCPGDSGPCGLEAGGGAWLSPASMQAESILVTWSERVKAERQSGWNIPWHSEVVNLSGLGFSDRRSAFNLNSPGKACFVRHLPHLPKFLVLMVASAEDTPFVPIAVCVRARGKCTLVLSARGFGVVVVI